MQEGILEDPFSLSSYPSDAGNLERGAFVECGERPERKEQDISESELGHFC